MSFGAIFFFFFFFPVVVTRDNRHCTNITVQLVEDFSFKCVLLMYLEDLCVDCSCVGMERNGVEYFVHIVICRLYELPPDAEYQLLTLTLMSFFKA